MPDWHSVMFPRVFSTVKLGTKACEGVISSKHFHAVDQILHAQHALKLPCLLTKHPAKDFSLEKYSKPFVEPARRGSK